MRPLYLHAQDTHECALRLQNSSCYLNRNLDTLRCVINNGVYGTHPQGFVALLIPARPPVVLIAETAGVEPQRGEEDAC